MTDISKLRNIGLVAHVDAGKTTITEQMLYKSGRTRALGSVDKGTAHTDSLDVERERGISVRAASTSFIWKDMKINLIDTPGHADFSSETERSLRVLDGAVLVISAVEGVQAQTEIIWKALEKLKIPTLIFINKIDRTGSDVKRVTDDIRKLLTTAAAPFELVVEEGTAVPSVLPVMPSGPDLEAETVKAAEVVKEAIIEQLAGNNEEFLKRYVEGQAFSIDEIYLEAILQTRGCLIYPIFFGAALKGVGIGGLLDAITGMLPPPGGDPEKPVSGIVFKLEHDKNFGRIAHIRLYDGTLRNRDQVRNATRDTYETVNWIRKPVSPKYEDMSVLHAGDIACVSGFNSTGIGDVLGEGGSIPPEYKIANPVLKVQAIARDASQLPQLVSALQELAGEDPLLDLEWRKDERELHINIMGTIQLEVLSSIIRSRFNMEVDFGRPAVIYKETPSQAGEGFVDYTMPKPCWAVLRFAIEPGERGSGLVYRSIVRDEAILQRYQNQVEKTIPVALKQGLYGWEVTDLKITLIEGEYHVMHTHPLDFVVATPMGVLDGLANTGTTLLEPVLQFRISVPEGMGDKVLGDIIQMRGEFDAPVLYNGIFTVEGLFPVSTSLEYPVRLGSISGGRGSMTVRPAGYKVCPLELGAVTPRRGVDPLDRSRYILSIRNALKS